MSKQTIHLDLTASFRGQAQELEQLKEIVDGLDHGVNFTVWHEFFDGSNNSKNIETDVVVRADVNFSQLFEIVSLVQSLHSNVKYSGKSNGVLVYTS